MQQLLDFNFYLKHKFWLGVFALAACILAWGTEFTGIVYVCPYCRVQRTIIGMLGLVLMTPLASHWIPRFLAIVVGFFGAVVAATQHFLNWKKISGGTFEFKSNLAVDPLILSGAALIFILFLMLIVYLQAPRLQQTQLNEPL